MEATRESFKRYGVEKGAAKFVDIKSVSALLSKPLPNKHNGLLALFCDYIIFRFKNEILRTANIDETSRLELQEKVRRLIKAVQARVSDANNPFNQLAADLPLRDYIEEVPGEFIGSFVGYRRSAAVNDIIRFTFQIERKGSASSMFVRYTNKYARQGEVKEVSGGGVYIDKTLFLFGHARTDTGSDGYRVQALQLLEGSTNALIGPVISRWGSSPIAARIVLIPWGKHNWTKKQKKMTREERRTDLIKPPTREGFFQYVDEVKENCRGLFPGMGDQGIFYYISNITDTVVIGNLKQENSLMKSEIQVREALHIYAQQLQADGKPEQAVTYRAALEELLSERARQQGPSY